MLSLEKGALVVAVLPVQDLWAVFCDDDGSLLADRVEARAFVNEPIEVCKKGHRFLTTYCMSQAPTGDLDDPTDLANFVGFARGKTEEEAITAMRRRLALEAAIEREEQQSAQGALAEDVEHG